MQKLPEHPQNHVEYVSEKTARSMRVLMREIKVDSVFTHRRSKGPFRRAFTRSSTSFCNVSAELGGGVAPGKLRYSARASYACVDTRNKKLTQGFVTLLVDGENRGENYTL